MLWFGVLKQQKKRFPFIATDEISIERSQQDTHVCVNILHKLMQMDIYSFQMRYQRQTNKEMNSSKSSLMNQQVDLNYL